MKDRNTLCKQN